MLAGGIVAAPVAAWAVRFVPARALGLMVAGLLLVTNVRELATWAELATSRWIGYGVVVALVAWAASAPYVGALLRPPTRRATPRSPRPPDAGRSLGRTRTLRRGGSTTSIAPRRGRADRDRGRLQR